MSHQQTWCSIYRHGVFKDWSAYTRTLNTCSVHENIFIHALRWCVAFYTHRIIEWCMCSAVRVYVKHTTCRTKNNVCVVFLGVMWSLYTHMVIEWCLKFMDMVWTDNVWLLCTVLYIFDDMSCSMDMGTATSNTYSSHKNFDISKFGCN